MWMKNTESKQTKKKKQIQNFALPVTGSVVEKNKQTTTTINKQTEKQVKQWEV